MDNKEGGDTRKVVYGILRFLDEEYNKTSMTADDKESLEVAVQCLERVFGVSLKDSSCTTPVSIRDLVLASGSPKNAPSGAGTAPDATPAPEGRPTSNTICLHELFGFGPPHTPTSSTTYEVDLGQTYVSPPEACDADKEIAEENKNKGNEEMKNGKIHEALSLYNGAIELDGSQAVYFCNRAAAFTKLENYVEALRDCQIACQLQPTYARAYGRMGVIYSQMGNHREALQCYRKAVMLEPNNESYINNLQVAQEMVGGGDASQVTGEGTVRPDLGTMFTNPGLLNVADQIFQNPEMHQMIRSFMSGILTGPQGNQSLESIIQLGHAVASQIQTASPSISEQLRDVNNQEPPSSPHNDSL